MHLAAARLLKQVTRLYGFGLRPVEEEAEEVCGGKGEATQNTLGRVCLSGAIIHDLRTHPKSAGEHNNPLPELAGGE